MTLHSVCVCVWSAHKNILCLLNAYGIKSREGGGESQLCCSESRPSQIRKVCWQYNYSSLVAFLEARICKPSRLNPAMQNVVGSYSYSSLDSLLSVVIMKLKLLSAVFTCEAFTKQGRVPERGSIQSSIIQSLSAFSLQWNWISGVFCDSICI